MCLGCTVSSGEPIETFKQESTFLLLVVLLMTVWLDTQVHIVPA